MSRFTSAIVSASNHSRYREWLSRKLGIERLPTSTAFQPWERDLMHSIPSFLLNHSRYRGWFDAETIADVNRLTGRSCTDLASAESAMFELIADDDPGRDEELVQALHRRLLRFSMIVAGTDPDRANPLFHELDPILE